MSHSIRIGSIEAASTSNNCLQQSETFSKHLHQPQPILGSLLPSVSVYPGLCVMPSNPISIPTVNFSRQSQDPSASLNDHSMPTSSPHSSSQSSQNSAAMYQALMLAATLESSRAYPFHASQYLSAFSNSLHNNNGGGGGGVPTMFNHSTTAQSTLSSSLPASYSAFSSSTNSSNEALAVSWYSNHNHNNLPPNQYNQLLYQLSTMGDSNSHSLSKSVPNSVIPNSMNSDITSSLKRPLVLSTQDNNKFTSKQSSSKKEQVVKRKRKSAKRPSSSDKTDMQISSIGHNGTIRTLLQTADAEDHFNKALKPNDLKYLESSTSGLSDSGTINTSVEAHFEKSLANFKKTHSPDCSTSYSQKSRCISISSDGGQSVSSLTICGLNDEGKECVDSSANQSGSSTSCSPASQLGEDEANNGSEETPSWEISNQTASTIIKPRSFKPKQAWLSQYDKIIRC